MRVYLRVLALAAAILLSAAAVWVWAQGGAAPAASLNKVGVLNVRQAIVTTAEGKVASAELQPQFAPRQTEHENLRKQIDDLQNRLRQGERTLSDDEKARLTRQGESLARRLERMQNELQEDVNAAQAEVIDRISRKMQDVLDRYARENAFAVIINSDSSGQQPSPVLYYSNQIYITQDIIRLYDQAYPVRAGAAPPPTKQPAKPPAQPPAKPPTQPPAKPPQR